MVAGQKIGDWNRFHVSDANNSFWIALQGSNILISTVNFVLWTRYRQSIYVPVSDPEFRVPK